MHSELTNLLPRSALRTLRRTYFMRLATVAAALLVIALIIHGVLLIPSYVQARAEVKREQAELDQLSKKAASSQEKEASARIAAIQADITHLGRLETLPTASGAVRAVLAVPHSGIGLSGFTFTAAQTQGGDSQMAISGQASNRDSLRQYALALGQLPYVRKADLPISAYAKESDIPFTITLTGTLKP